MLTMQEKQRLAEVYAPILFFHPEETFEPIAPEAFMRDSAMWVNRPNRDEREAWGDGGHDLEDPFPRAPMIARGRIGLDAATLGDEDTLITSSPDDDGFRPFQVSDEERELFLQSVSWGQGGPLLGEPVAPNIPIASAENTFELPGVSTGLPQFWVDVRDQDDIGAVPRGQDRLSPPPGFPTVLQDMYRTGYWLLTYRFFFAYHVEQLSQCEVHSEEIRARRANALHADHLHGSYEGDWQALSVLIRNPGMPNPMPSPTAPLPDVPVSPLDLADADFPTPDFAGFSRRSRGVLNNIAAGILEPADMTVVVSNRVNGGQVRATGRHIHAFVAKGTHNLYASPGTVAAPRLDKEVLKMIEVLNPCLITDDLYEFLGEVDEVVATVEDVVSTGKAAGISVAKILGSAAGGGILGGPIGAAIGAIGGAIAAGIEAALREDPEAPFEQPDPPRAPPEVDDGPPSMDDEDGAPDFGTVVVPPDLLQSFSEALEDEAITIKPWAGPAGRFVIDRTDGVQPWWEPDGSHPFGYGGLWGARVERDPFSRRGGSRIPPFDATFINAVLTT
ncbi:hypothetical protein KUV47_00455 [Vannielia litorea]|uniref:hypothetical protein n=1 Tax=Vannielia litorea TaxID=1217970 RepID=UPI001C93C393|nr:hypothetical protein [Vannielia litorea]MBY6151667.1 hypothetical protein [Vannielia litorea]